MVPAYCTAWTSFKTSSISTLIYILCNQQLQVQPQFLLTADIVWAAGGVVIDDGTAQY